MHRMSEPELLALTADYLNRYAMLKEELAQLRHDVEDGTPMSESELLASYGIRCPKCKRRLTLKGQDIPMHYLFNDLTTGKKLPRVGKGKQLCPLTGEVFMHEQFKAQAHLPSEFRI